MFLYGMNLMSSGLQKASGDKLRSFLSAMTSNPFKGVMTGLGITSLIQSSSATTVMVVSFVNAGLLTLGELIVGFSLLFLGLSFMKESVPDLNQTPQVLELPFLLIPLSWQPSRHLMRSSILQRYQGKVWGM